MLSDYKIYLLKFFDFYDDYDVSTVEVKDLGDIISTMNNTKDEQALIISVKSNQLNIISGSQKFLISISLFGEVTYNYVGCGTSEEVALRKNSEDVFEFPPEMYATVEQVFEVVAKFLEYGTLDLTKNFQIAKYMKNFVKF